jgi:ATP-dependent Clp protease ATP-binding subunit ClpB
MNTQRFTIKSQEMISMMQELASELGHQEILALHMLKAMLAQEDTLIMPIMQKLELSVTGIKNQLDAALQKLPRISGAVRQYLSQEVLDILHQAEREADQLQDDYISLEHLLLALVAKGKEAANILKANGLQPGKLLQALKELRGNQRVDDQNPEAKYQALEKYARNLTRLARTGKLDPVIGRDEEIRRSIQILSRRRKNNPILIGEPGVGKTAIAGGKGEGLLFAKGEIVKKVPEHRLVAELVSLVQDYIKLS